VGDFGWPPGLAEAGRDSVEARLFALGAYLLVARPNTQICNRATNWTTGDSEVDLTAASLPEYQIGMGNLATQDTIAFPAPCLEGPYGPCDRALAQNPLLVREFENGTVVVDYRNFHSWIPDKVLSEEDSLAAFRKDTLHTYYFQGRKYLLKADGMTLIEGGRFWTEAVDDTLPMWGRLAAILMNTPIASPSIEDEALYPLYRDGSVPSFIAVQAQSWSWSQMWVEVDASDIGGLPSVVLRDDGDAVGGHDLIANDKVYSSENFYGWSAGPGVYTLPIYARDEYGYSTYGTVTVEIMEAPPQMLFENKSVGSGLAYNGDPSCSAAIDYNGDGLTDLMLGMKGDPGCMQKCEGMNGGAPHFGNVTGTAFGGETVPAGIRSLSVADYDLNGKPDIFVAHDSQPRLYHHSHDSDTFTNEAGVTGLAASANYSWTGAWGDYDQNGRPDLLVGRWSFDGQDPDTSQGLRLPFYLLRNVASGAEATFVVQNEQAGITGGPLAACTAVLWTYANSDSLLDLIVGDIKGRSRIYLNLGADDLGQYSFGDSTSTWFQPNGLGDPAVRCMASIDYDNDKRLDLVVGQWQTGNHCTTIRHNEGNCLHWMYWPVFGQGILTAVNGLQTLDYDLNGHQDFLVLPAPGQGDIALFANRDPGSTAFRFTDVAAKTGIDAGDANCATLWDANKDGDMELFLGRPASTQQFLYRSIAVTAEDALGKNFVQVQLAGNGVDNSVLGAGALVRFHPMDAGADTLQQAMMVDLGGGGPSPQTQRLMFGTGDQSRRVKATVWWPNGRVQVDTMLVSSTAATIKTITEPAGAPVFVSGSTAAQYTALPGGSAIWRFKWRTADWSNPALDRVVVYDPVSDPPPPQFCHIETVTLRGSQLGVTATIAPSPLGGYLHTVTWQAGPCIGGCTYRYKAYSQNGGHETPSAERSFSLSVCLE